jgi:GH15 family glucan-1,4-alpha-glucosidase
VPRPLVLGNGSFLLGIDSAYSIRDLFYPQVGRYNHLSGHRIRMGVWLGGEFSWVDDQAWIKKLSYREGSLNSACDLRNEQLGISVRTEEAVSHRDHWFVRRMQFSGPKHAEVRIFFTHDLRIMESDIGDTAFYHPGMNGIVHYKGPCHFLFGGEKLHQYACGLKGFGGFEGTWRDAEDGELSMNPIAQGSVDSTLSLSLSLDAKGLATTHYWILAADDLEHLEQSCQRFQELGPSRVLEETYAHWHGWREITHERLTNVPPRIAAMSEQSLLIMRTHIDNGGAIIAATDSDIMETNRANYCYMWPRDGALISEVLDRAGHHHLPRAFFEFCKTILPKDRPILRQKYTADGKLGATWHPWVLDGKPSTPFQQDETALVICAMWHHHQCFPDPAAVREHFDRFIAPAADFMLKHRDAATGLPLPSYDLWEERLGIHTYTVCTVIAGLGAAAQAAEELGDERSGSYLEAADSIKEAMLRHLVDASTAAFYRRVELKGDAVSPDRVVDSSVLHVGLLGILPMKDPRVKATAEMVEQQLWVKGIGGLARYEGDYYFRRHDHLPGNPWIICTLWLAQHKIKSGDNAGAEKLLNWCCDRAASTGVLPEQVDAVTGEPLSVSPLTWSHAEFVKTAFDLAQARA